MPIRFCTSFVAKPCIHLSPQRRSIWGLNQIGNFIFEHNKRRVLQEILPKNMALKFQHSSLAVDPHDKTSLPLLRHHDVNKILQFFLSQAKLCHSRKHITCIVAHCSRGGLTTTVRNELFHLIEEERSKESDERFCAAHVSFKERNRKEEVPLFLAKQLQWSSVAKIETRELYKMVSFLLTLFPPTVEPGDLRDALHRTVEILHKDKVHPVLILDDLEYALNSKYAFEEDVERLLATLMELSSKISVLLLTSDRKAAQALKRIRDFHEQTEVFYWPLLSKALFQDYMKQFELDLSEEELQLVIDTVENNIGDLAHVAERLRNGDPFDDALNNIIRQTHQNMHEFFGSSHIYLAEAKSNMDAFTFRTIAYQLLSKLLDHSSTPKSNESSALPMHEILNVDVKMPSPETPVNLEDKLFVLEMLLSAETGILGEMTNQAKQIFISPEGEEEDGRSRDMHHERLVYWTSGKYKVAFSFLRESAFLKSLLHSPQAK